MGKASRIKKSENNIVSKGSKKKNSEKSAVKISTETKHDFKNVRVLLKRLPDLLLQVKSPLLHETSPEHSEPDAEESLEPDPIVFPIQYRSKELHPITGSQSKSQPPSPIYSEESNSVNLTHEYTHKKSAKGFLASIAIEEILNSSHIDSAIFSTKDSTSSIKEDTKQQQITENESNRQSFPQIVERGEVLASVHADSGEEIMSSHTEHAEQQLLEVDPSRMTADNQLYSLPFQEYKTISIQELGSNDFREKYRNKLVVNDEVVSSGSSIIKALAEKMNKTKKAVHLLVKRKLGNLPYEKKNDGSAFAERDNVDISQESKKDIVETREKNENENIKISQKDNLASFNGQFDLKDTVMFEIECRQTKHRGKNIEKQFVKSGWTSKLALFLYDTTKVHCKYDFKHIWILKNGSISTNGKCDCGSIVEVTLIKNILNVNISNINESFKHIRRYQAKGAIKGSFSEMLDNRSALAIQTKIVNNIITDNEILADNFIPVLPKINAIRLLKHKAHRNDKDPMDMILEWKESIHKNVISAVGHSPFFVFYRSGLQLAWYLAELKRRKYIMISIDATGSLVTPPARSQKIEGSDKLKHIFLYSIMAKTEKKSVPLAQMLSQDQSSEFIALFLQKMFKNLKQPREVVCDESKALLKALVKTFTKCNDMEIYIASCMSALLNGTTPPNCYIRIDRSHFVKNITRKINHRDYRKRNFFRCVIGYLIQCENFKTVRKIISDFFTLILSENDGYDEFGVELPSECAKKRLLALCSTHDETAEYTSDSDTLQIDDPEKDLDFSVNVKWIDDIIANIVMKISENYHENLYFNPNEKKMYVNIFSSIVLWSNVMNSQFESTAMKATSSDVESYFKSLKNEILPRKMMRVDEFLQYHIAFVNAEIKLNAMSNVLVTNNVVKRKRSNSLCEKSPISDAKRKRSNSVEGKHAQVNSPQSEDDEERWRNKNPRIKTTTTSRRAINSMLNPNVDICGSIMLLRNGFFSTVAKYSIQTMNTCPFDSPFANIAGMYADYPEVKKQINELKKNCKFSQIICEMFTKVGSLAIKQNKLLRLRNVILLEVFKNAEDSIEFENGLISLDCGSNVNYIIPKILPQELYSYSREKRCNQCNRTVLSNRCFIDINFEEYDTLGIKKLNECLLNTLIAETPSTCLSNTCGGSEMFVNTKFSSFIVIDLQLEYTIKCITLNEIPKSLNILGTQFSLTGCIEFIGNVREMILNKSSIGHYVSHVYRSNNSWEMYDDTKCKVFRSDPNIKIQGQVLFYVKRNHIN